MDGIGAGSSCLVYIFIPSFCKYWSTYPVLGSILSTRDTVTCTDIAPAEFTFMSDEIWIRLWKALQATLQILYFVP